MPNTEKYNPLNLLYTNTAFAYFHGDENKMRHHYNGFLKNYSEYEPLLQENIRTAFYQNGIYIPLKAETINRIHGAELSFNILGCLLTIQHILRQNADIPVSFNALATIYIPRRPHHPDDVLDISGRRENRQTEKDAPFSDGNEKRLTVGDLLSVIRYSMNVLEALPPSEKTSEIQDTIVILSSLDLALNNQKSDSPINKSLHLVNRILSSTIKKALDKEEDRRNIGQMSLMVDLAIDFFTSPPTDPRCIPSAWPFRYRS